MAAFDVCGSKVNLGDRPGFLILDLPTIRAHQKQAVDSVSEFLVIAKDDAFALLKKHGWCGDHLFEAWFEGNIDASKYSCSTTNGDEDMCGICFDRFAASQVTKTLCGHTFCKVCMSSYISVELKNGAKVLDLVCATEKCGRTVGPTLSKSLLSEEEVSLYQRFETSTYVTDNPLIKWCPAPECCYAIAPKDVNDANDVECYKYHGFCWKCSNGSHYPVDCTIARRCGIKWQNAAAVDWKKANAKKCPKCRTPIQLFTGCFHLTCTCKHQFCCYLDSYPWRRTL